MDDSFAFSERKSIRKSTVKKSEETQQRVKKRKEEGPRKHRRNKDYFYEPTQEEKLAEAKLTEEENLKSLGISWMLLMCISQIMSIVHCINLC